MKYRLHALIAFTALLFLSCASSIKTVCDHDVQVDFNSYKTYNFLPWNSGNSEYVTKSAQKKLYGMLEDQLGKIGYEKVNGGGDLAVNLLVLLDEKRDATAYTRYYNTGSFGYYSAFGYGISSTTYYKKKDVLEGTLIVDIFDQKEKKLVWQGVAILEIVEDDRQRERQVDFAIKKIFGSFPKN